MLQNDHIVPWCLENNVKCIEISVNHHIIIIIIIIITIREFWAILLFTQSSVHHRCIYRCNNIFQTFRL